MWTIREQPLQENGEVGLDESSLFFTALTALSIRRNGSVGFGGVPLLRAGLRLPTRLSCWSPALDQIPTRH